MDSLKQALDGLPIPLAPRVALDKHTYCKVDYHTAMKLVVAHHYLHRVCPCSWAYGIGVGSDLAGVMVIGKSRSQTTCCGVVGETLADVRAKRGRNQDVYELKRVLVHDVLPRNTESKFMGWVFDQLRIENPRMILVSYADASVGHTGYLYQSTNWHYCGMTRTWQARTKKHKYVMFLDKRDRKLLTWEQEPYPKKSDTK